MRANLRPSQLARSPLKLTPERIAPQPTGNANAARKVAGNSRSAPVRAIVEGPPGQGFDPAGKLFGNLTWFDPPTYESPDPKELPDLQPAEDKIMLQVQDTRTPEGSRDALALANVGKDKLWRDYLGAFRQHAGLGKYLAAMVVLQCVILVDAIIANLDKFRYNEPRPFQKDPRIHYLGGRPAGSAHPSGHAATGYAAATVLSHFWPERSAEFYRAAANLGRSRVYLGVHYPGDVADGARLGLRVGRFLVRLFTFGGTAPGPETAPA